MWGDNPNDRQTVSAKSLRAEVIAALRQLRSGVYRFPGGNFVSVHEWREDIGDPDKRPPVMDSVWHAVQPNDVGADELTTLCRLRAANGHPQPYGVKLWGIGNEMWGEWQFGVMPDATTGSKQAQRVSGKLAPE